MGEWERGAQCFFVNSRISEALKTMRVPYRKCTLCSTDKASPVIRRRVASRSSDIKLYCCAWWDARCAWEEHVNVEDKESANKHQLFKFADNCDHSHAHFSHSHTQNHTKLSLTYTSTCLKAPKVPRNMHVFHQSPCTTFARIQ